MSRAASDQEGTAGERHCSLCTEFTLGSGLRRSRAGIGQRTWGSVCLFNSMGYNLLRLPSSLFRRVFLLLEDFEYSCY